MIYNTSTNQIEYEDGRPCLSVLCTELTAGKLFEIADTLTLLLSGDLGEDFGAMRERAEEAEENERIASNRVEFLEDTIKEAQTNLADAGV